MLPYRHTQTGKLLLALVAVPIAVIIWVTIFIEATTAALPVLGLMVVALLLFGTLTVEVDRESVLIRFGPGVIRQRFPLSEVRAVRLVRNKWYYGWGIRIIPGGWLYCVSGLDAVELEMASGPRHRIGTDRPQELLAAIREALGAGAR